MRAKRILIALVLGGSASLVACGKGDGTSKQDPNRPAVVKLPPPILPSDTAHPDTMGTYRERMDQLKQRLLPWYALVGATAVYGDRRTILQFYSTDATLRLGNTTFTGAVEIANGLVELAKRNSVKEFERMSRVVNATDSVAVDSGSYTILSRRQGGMASDQRGTYVSTWKRRPGGDPDWVIRHDVLTPTSTKPAKK
jgi:hypothetical protein